MRLTRVYLAGLFFIAVAAVAIRRADPQVNPMVPRTAEAEMPGTVAA
jgi:hypothetical protein